MFNRLRNESGSVVITSALIIGLVAVVFERGLPLPLSASQDRQNEKLMPSRHTITPRLELRLL